MSHMAYEWLHTACFSQKETKQNKIQQLEDPWGEVEIFSLD